MKDFRRFTTQSLCNKSGFYGYKRFFFAVGRKKHFFSHSCCTFDFHFRCSSCQSGNVENYCRKRKKFQQQEEVFALLTCPKWTDENERVTNSNSLKGGTNLLLSSTQRFTKQEHSVWKSLQNVSSEFSRKKYQEKIIRFSAIMLSL